MWAFIAVVFVALSNAECSGTEKDDCKTKSGCEWNHRALACVKAGETPTCEEINRPRLCYDRSECWYNRKDSYCITRACESAKRRRVCTKVFGQLFGMKCTFMNGKCSTERSGASRGCEGKVKEYCSRGCFWDEGSATCASAVAKSASSPYDWDNRMEFVIRYLYDTNGNGYADQGDFTDSSIWNDFAARADQNKDGKVTGLEMKMAAMSQTIGKAYADIPNSFKFFINGLHDATDYDGDGSIHIEEYRTETRRRNLSSWTDLEINEAYEKIVNEEDKKHGGITLERYQYLYSRFLGNPDPATDGVYMFGPLVVLN